MMDFVNKYLLGAAIPILLIGGGIYFSVILKAFHLRMPFKILKILTAQRSNRGCSLFRALALALAGTLGVGNIVGVSAAIVTGGFGAVFWMWVSAFCAMILKYAEVVLAMRHRRFDKNGVPHGSAMYYINDVFKKHNMKRLGAFLSGLFAILCLLCVISMGGMIQSNAISDALCGVINADPIICGISLAVITVWVIIKGSGTISRITEILVPLMSVGYIVLSLAVLVIKREALPEAFEMIFKNAFNSTSALGGFIGFLLSDTLRAGCTRGLISNEAGCGTAPMAHCSSTSISAAEQGVFGIFEVFVDTIVLCTMTALVVIVNYPHLNTDKGWLMLTFDAYKTTLGSYATTFLAFAVLAFGFATVLCFGHYGIEATKYFSEKRSAQNLFAVIYCIAVFFGAGCSPEVVWGISDLAIGCMTVINLVVLVMGKDEIKDETEILFKSNQKNKKIKKIFKKCIDKQKRL
jgi:AGCS family alanine or glycine:cation symporter